MKASLIALVIVGLVAVGLPTTHAVRYTVHNTKVTFFEAWQQCITKGGTLASIQTSRQNDLVYAAIKKAGGDSEWWLSGTDLGLEGSFTWISNNTPVGSPHGYINYHSGEPNNAGSGENCITMVNDGTWYDQSCDKKYYYVCEYYSV